MLFDELTAETAPRRQPDQLPTIKCLSGTHHDRQHQTWPTDAYLGGRRYRAEVQNDTKCAEMSHVRGSGALVTVLHSRKEGERSSLPICTDSGESIRLQLDVEWTRFTHTGVYSLGGVEGEWARLPQACQGDPLTAVQDAEPAEHLLGDSCGLRNVFWEECDPVCRSFWYVSLRVHVRRFICFAGLLRHQVPLHVALEPVPLAEA